MAHHRDGGWVLLLVHETYGAQHISNIQRPEVALRVKINETCPLQPVSAVFLKFCCVFHSSFIPGELSTRYTPCCTLEAQDHIYVVYVNTYTKDYKTGIIEEVQQQVTHVSTDQIVPLDVRPDTRPKGFVSPTGIFAC